MRREVIDVKNYQKNKNGVELSSVVRIVRRLTTGES